jgi:hypothetical protein
MCWRIADEIGMFVFGIDFFVTDKSTITSTESRIEQECLATIRFAGQRQLDSPVL